MSTMQKLMSMFSKKNNEDNNTSHMFTPIITKESLYKKTQYFLKMMYFVYKYQL